MAAAKWKPFPHPAKAYQYAGEALKKNWERLHRGDCEPWPKEKTVQEAWRLFHAGEFGEAVAAGLSAGGPGVTAANKAQAIYANSVETQEARRIALFEEVMKRAEAQARDEPKNANAHYLYAYAAGRYSQRISVAKALAQGYGGKIRAALAYNRAASSTIFLPCIITRPLAISTWAMGESGASFTALRK